MNTKTRVFVFTFENRKLAKETCPRIVKGGEGCPTASTKMGQETTGRTGRQIPSTIYGFDVANPQCC
jgi:hypothetical protein